MKLSQKQFSLLAEIAENKTILTQRELAERTDMSVGSVNRLVKEMASRNWIHDGMVTELGLEALEPYRVKRAVFLAAGFGSRLVPVTLNTPKALIRVKGKRIIDTLLDAVLAAGIREIYIVRGYLAEEFDQLLYKYPMIRFVENPAYNETNNISSILCAKAHLQNAYVLEADLLLRNPGLIKKYQYASNYLGVPVERTDDWCFRAENGVIKEVRVGGVNCHHMFGISYWSGEDGARLEKDIPAAYDSPGGRERFFEYVPLTYCKDSYQVHVRPCSFADIAEVDTLSELKALDSTYSI